jgi:cytoskeletal protein RodZ
LNENGSDKKINEHSFDWGPPANKSSEAVKEWLVYFFLLVLLGVGVWFLLDFNSEDTKKLSEVLNKSSEVKTSNKAMSVTIDKNRKGNFIVQVGAFAEEDEAQKSIEKLKASGFSPKLEEPDENSEIYRILIGPFNNENEAETVSEQLNNQDFHSFVLEAP